MTVVSTPFACENLQSKGYRSDIDLVTGWVIPQSTLGDK